MSWAIALCLLCLMKSTLSIKCWTLKNSVGKQNSDQLSCLGAMDFNLDRTFG